MEEEKKLRKYANTVIIKNEFSYLRLMDEVKLFLQKVNANLTGNRKKTRLPLHPLPTCMYLAKCCRIKKC
jgi:hypothetical protein